MSKLSRRAVLAGLATCTLTPHRAFADNSAPLRIIYPYPPGGSADAVARIIAEHLQKALGRPVVVENKTGAGGLIGAQTVAKAPADGATILLAAAGQITLQPLLIANPGYDPFTDFVPIAQIVTFDQALAICNQIPAANLAELAKWMKADAGRATFGSPGEGTGAHLAGLAFGRKFDIAMTHVPYRGTPLALPDLISGRLPMFVASSAELTAHHKRGQIRIVSLSGTARSHFLPDVPTMQEAGIDFDGSAWFGFYAPAATPKDVVARLEKEIMAAMALPQTRASAEAVGFEPTGISGAELLSIQRMQRDRWSAFVKTAGLKPQ